MNQPEGIKREFLFNFECTLYVLCYLVENVARQQSGATLGRVRDDGQRHYPLHRQDRHSHHQQVLQHIDVAFKFEK